MSDSAPLYNSRIAKIYIQYLQKNHSDIDIDSILEEAGIANYEIEDPAHWFTQNQQDRLHDILITRTGNPNIARDAGRYATSSEGLGATKQYAASLMSPTAAYLLIEKIYALMSRGAKINVKKIGSNQVEITATPAPGVNEKPYQCENRSGQFESVARLFTDKFAKIDHPSCVHKGDDCCRYIITWTKAPKILFKLIRNYVLLGSIFSLLILLFILPLLTWGIVALVCTFITLLLSYYTEGIEKRALIRTVETQRIAAQDNIVEIMGHATGQSPDGFHFLCPLQLCMQLFFFLTGPFELGNVVSNTKNSDKIVILVENGFIGPGNPHLNAGFFYGFIFVDHRSFRILLQGFGELFKAKPF